jgi:hypothetical protein
MGSGLLFFSDDGVDDLLCDPVGDTQVETGDDDEAHDHGGGLRDLTTIGPLYALQLGPRRAQEADEARRAPPRGRSRGARSDDVGALDRRRGDGGLLELVVEVVVVLVAEGLTRGLPVLLVRDERVIGVALGIGGQAAGTSARYGCERAGPGFWARRALRCLARCRSRATGDRPR